MKCIDLLNDIINKTKLKNKETKASEILFEYVTGYTFSDIYINNNIEIEDKKVLEFNKLLSLYLDLNKPVQYIIGEAYFYGYKFIVNENVLIPRMETEELCENVLNLYNKYFKGKKVKVVDIGTGSGCIPITLKKEESNLEVYASDISKKALEVAKLNAKNLDANITFFEGDMLAPFKNMKFDILVSNPPYIPNNEYVDPLVLQNEPHQALFAGDDGLKYYKEILSGANDILNEKCIIAFEHGYFLKDKIEELARIYFPNSLIYSVKDLEKKDRMTFIIRGFKNE